MKARLEDKRALTEQPELRSAFVSLTVAERFAEQHILDARDRELFVRRVRAVMEASARSANPRPAQPPRRVDRDPPNR